MASLKQESLPQPWPRLTVAQIVAFLATVKQCILPQQMRVGNDDTSPFTAHGREWGVKFVASFIMEDGLDKACACEGALGLVSHDQACTGLQPLWAVHEAEPDQGNAAR